MPGTDRVVHDHQVAVLVSTSYGAGWSTWNPETSKSMLFDPQLVDIMVSGAADRLDQARALARLKYPGADLGGIDDSFQVQWIDEGWYFRVVEYDGAERIELRDRIDWIRA